MDREISTAEACLVGAVIGLLCGALAVVTTVGLFG